MTDDDATAEVGWVAREALALSTESVGADTHRWAEFIDRKRALLDYFEADHDQ